MNRYRLVAGTLLLLSGVTHVVQLAFYGHQAHTQVVATVVASGFGIAYFLIGLFLLRKSNWALWAGAVLPSIGAVLGMCRFIFVHPNPFSVFHVALDFIIVPCCVLSIKHVRNATR
ncbi:MAG: hypothetical protein GWP08_09905 [Nitrospiraceae bacterium]|nr:hypothetical protein [Nitrospiraceae bacterium]